LWRVGCRQSSCDSCHVGKSNLQANSKRRWTLASTTPPVCTRKDGKGTAEKCTRWSNSTMRSNSRSRCSLPQSTVQKRPSSGSEIARPQAQVAFGSRGFRQVLHASARQHVGCIDYGGGISRCGEEEQEEVADREPLPLGCSSLQATDRPCNVQRINASSAEA
jgi:hypothetical protein